MTPRTIAHQAPLSMGFSRQEYWSGLPFPSPEDLPDPGIEPTSPALVGRFWVTWEATNQLYVYIYPLPLRPPPILPFSGHRAPSWVPYVIQQLPTSSLFYTWCSVCMSILISIVSSSLFPPPPTRCVHVPVLYIGISIPALELSSSVPFF